MTPVGDSMRISPAHNIVVEAVGPGTRFASSKVECLHRWWMSVRRGEPPRRSDFDIIDHWDLAPCIYLVQAISDGEFRLRVSGDAVQRLFGFSNVGAIVGHQQLTGNRIKSGHLPVG